MSYRGGRGGNLRRYAPQTTTLDSLFYYFLNIEERDHPESEFRKSWLKIHHFPFTAKNLNLILLKSAKLIARYQNEDDWNNPEFAEKLRKIIQQYFGLWQSSALREMEHFIPDSLSNISVALEILGIVPSAEFKRQIDKKTSQHSPNFKPHHFSMIFSANAALGQTSPTQIGKTLLSRIERNSNFLQNTHKTDLLWFIAVADSISPLPEYKALAKILSKQLPNHIRHLAAQKMRHDALDWFDIPHQFENPYREETTSKIETKLRTFFENASIRTEKIDKPIAGYNQAIDFTAFFDSQAVHVEVDGSFHFNDRGGIPPKTDPFNIPYDGNTLFRSALLHKAAPTAKILRIPYPVTDMLLGNDHRGYSLDCRQKMAKTFLSLAANAEGGVYRASMTDAPAKEQIPIIQSLIRSRAAPAAQRHVA